MAHSFFLDSQSYSPERVLIIAELGTSHGADIEKAKDLVLAARESGADCVKFQIVYADEILHPHTGDVPLPGGTIPLYERFKQLECPPEFFAEMKEFTEKNNLLFLCTPFGLRSAGELKRLSPRAVKIASPELNYTALLEAAASFAVPAFLSSGVSRLGDIEEALSFFRDVPVCLLHCVTAYPAPETDYNLRVIKNLGDIFGVSVGVSDHSLDSELVPALAVAMGASAVEKHFCLSRRDPGLDDPIALPPEEFRNMVSAIRRVSAEGPEAGIAAYVSERGRDLVERILGDGVKRLAPSEEASYERTRRSIHALEYIKRGEVFTAQNTAVLRTEKKLRPGIPPAFEKKITGRQAARDIPAGEGIRFEDI